MKLRKLPSSRPPQRYLALRIHSSVPLRYENLKAAALNQLLEWLGEDEFARAGLRFIRNTWSGNAPASEKRARETAGEPASSSAQRAPALATALLQCHPKYVDRVKLGLALLAQVGDSRVIISCGRVSGTIKGASR